MLAATYTDRCQAHGVKTNSVFLRSLPEDSPNLTKIDLSLNFVGKNGLLPIIETAKTAPNLTTIVLRDNYIGNDILTTVLDILSGHPSLTALDLSNNPLSHTSSKPLIAFLKANEGVTNLKVEGTLLNAASVKNIQKKATEKRCEWGLEVSCVRQDTSMVLEDPLPAPRVPTTHIVFAEGEYFNLLVHLCNDRQDRFPYVHILQRTIYGK